MRLRYESDQFDLILIFDTAFDGLTDLNQRMGKADDIVQSVIIHR